MLFTALPLPSKVKSVGNIVWDAFLEAKFQIWSIIAFRTVASVTVMAVNRVHAKVGIRMISVYMHDK